MAGHSKWQNIKHTKESADQAKSMMFSKMSHEIKRAVAESGGNTNPNTNHKLAAAVNKCNAMNMPKSTLNKILANSLKKVAAGKQFQFEFVGRENSVFLVDVRTDKPGHHE